MMACKTVGFASPGFESWTCHAKAQVRAGDAEVRHGFLGAERGIVQVPEERHQLRADPATWATIARTCAGLATACGFTAPTVFGAFHCTWWIG
jgi:hypothetical protein